jgi:putative flippase GtrA
MAMARATGSFGQSLVGLAGFLLRQRLIRFGSVGLLGTLVNLGILYLGQEYLFTALTDPDLRLDLALALAIFVATLNNFTWNRLWTWRDRRRTQGSRLLLQLGQYFLASGFSILLQILMTKMLVLYLYYLLANLLAIALAAVVSYLLNDTWTFGLLRLRGKVTTGE